MPRALLLVVTVAALLAASLAPLGPGAVAVSVADNDAGTGRDAPDAAGFAPLLASGSYAGTLTPPVDRLDYYAFHADAGQLIRLAQAAGPGVRVRAYFVDAGQAACGESCGRYSTDVLPGESTAFLAPEGGAWYLVVYPFAENRVGATPYGFTVSAEAAPASHVATVTTAWSVLEGSSATWGHHTLALEVATPDLETKPSKTANTDPYTAFVLIELKEAGAKPYQFRTILNGGGTGTRVTSSAAPVDAPVPVSVEQGRGLHTSVRVTFNGPGTFRVTTVHTGHSPRVSLVYGADVPADVRFASGDGAVEVSASDLPATVAAPGLLVAPDRDFTHTIEGRFVGIFTYPAAAATGTTGYATTPSGERRALDPICVCVLFTEPEQGTWGFHVGPYNSVGADADTNFLAGAVVPRLGLY